MPVEQVLLSDNEYIVQMHIVQDNQMISEGIKMSHYN